MKGLVILVVALMVDSINVEGKSLNSLNDEDLEAALLRFARWMKESEAAGEAFVSREVDATIAPLEKVAEPTVADHVDEATPGQIEVTTPSPIHGATSGSIDEVTSGPIDEATNGEQPVEATLSPSDAKIMRLAKKFRALLRMLNKDSFDDFRFNPFAFDLGLNNQRAKMSAIFKLLKKFPSPLHKSFSTESKVDGGDFRMNTKIDNESGKGRNMFSYLRTGSFQKGGLESFQGGGLNSDDWMDDISA